MLRAVVLFLALIFSTTATACDTATEDKIQGTIASEPSSLVRLIEGNNLNIFLTALKKQKYIIGMIDNVERLYIVNAGTTSNHEPDNVWLYFIHDGCLAYAIPAEKSFIMGLLP